MSQAAKDALLVVALFLSFILFWLVAGPTEAMSGSPLRPICGDTDKTLIVYSRQPRHQTRIGELQDAANWQHMRDVGRYRTFTESDVVLDCRDKRVMYIHNCTQDDSEICAAMEAKVSPDGNRIVYTVYRGKTLSRIKPVNGGPLTDLEEFTFTSAELWVHNVAIGQSHKVGEGGAADWCGNRCLVFEKEVDVFPSLGYAGNYYPSRSHQLHRGDLYAGKLTNVANLTPHEMYVMNPRQMTDGRIIYSSWQGYYPRCVGMSPRNCWWLIGIQSNGTGPTEAEYAAHGTVVIGITALISDWVDPLRRGEGGTQTKAPRPISEIYRDYYTVPNYYRSNSTGPFGMIMGYENKPGEGAYYSKHVPAAIYRKESPGSGRFTPSTLQPLTPYGQDQDLDYPRMHKDGRAAGRASYAEPWPGDGPEYLFTHARGWCFEAARPEQANEAAMGGEPTCKKEIRLAKQLVVSNPFDPAQSEVIACGALRWQCWDAHAVADWQSLYGLEGPPAPEPIQSGPTMLRVVDARSSELKPFINASEQDKVTFQGNATNGNSEDLEYVVITYVDLWTKLPTDRGFQAKPKETKHRVAADGSVEIPVDCEKPFLMHGETEGGAVTATDNSPLSLRCGEVRTCHGCHDAHSEEGIKAIGTAEERFSKTLSAREAL